MLLEDSKRQLINVAYKAIEYGLEKNKLWLPNIDDYHESLRVDRAVFVTIKKDLALRGCIGTLKANGPLVLNVAKYANQAAFHDPRFKPLTKNEFSRINIHISILTPEEALIFEDEEDLVQKLRPGIDGLIIEKGARKATFLPSVWEQIPDAKIFLQHLKLKARIAEFDCPEQAWIYQAESISEDENTLNDASTGSG